MTTRTPRPRYVGWSSIGVAAVVTLASAFEIVNSLVLNSPRPSHEHWWF